MPFGAIADPWFYAVAAPAVLLVGISKGGFAGGFGMLGVPLMALVVSPLEAAAVLLPILIVMDMQGLWVYRGQWRGDVLKVLIPAAALGIGFGWATAGLVDEAAVRLIIGLIAISFALNHWTGGAIFRDKGGARHGGFWGAVAGFTSFVSHAGGPPFQVYALRLGLDKMIYVGTSVYFFAAINLIKLGPYIAIGSLDLSELGTALILMPLAPIGMLTGIKLLKIVPQEPFYRIAYIGLFLAGLKLVWDGASAIL